MAPFGQGIRLAAGGEDQIHLVSRQTAGVTFNAERVTLRLYFWRRRVVIDPVNINRAQMNMPAFA